MSYLLSQNNISLETLKQIYQLINTNSLINIKELSPKDLASIQEFFTILYINIKQLPLKTSIFDEKIFPLKYLFPYNPQEYFYKDNHPIKRAILNKDNIPITITKEKTQEVITILTTNNIPLTNVIAEEAFRIYFKNGLNSLNDFIDKLKTYDQLIPTTKRKLLIK